MRNLLACAVMLVAAVSATGDGPPRPALPCDCAVTSVCTCPAGACECVACRLSAEKADLTDQIRQMKAKLAAYAGLAAELKQTRSELDRLKSERATASRPATYYPAPTVRTIPYSGGMYSPPVVWPGSVQTFAPAMPAGACSS